MLTGKFLLKRRRDRLSAEAPGALEDALTDVRTVPARQNIVNEDETITQSTYLVHGFLSRYVDGRCGQRQLVAIHIPGDFVDLHSFPLERIDHQVATMTDVTIASVRHDALDGLMARHPTLVRLLWFSTMLDAAISENGSSDWAICRRSAASLISSAPLRRGFQSLTLPRKRASTFR